MPCRRVPMGDGFAFVCGPAPKAPICKCGSRRRADLLCDWIVEKPDKTCDAQICPVCTTSPAPDKDLCPTHAKAWAAHPRNPNR